MRMVCTDVDAIRSPQTASERLLESGGSMPCQFDINAANGFELTMLTLREAL